MPRSFFPASACRASTSASHHQAVERVILAMRTQLYEQLSLQALAEIAILSPFHFDRIFRQITGIPPCQFLGALRLEAAKRLLLTTRLSVTEICFEVGYNSLGTFITRFTQLVGLPPRQLRNLAENSEGLSMESALSDKKESHRSATGKVGARGRVESPDGFSAPVIVGLFPTPIPQGRPVACTLLSKPGAYRINNIPDGDYYAFAASFKWSNDPLAYLLPEEGSVRVGVSRKQLEVRDGEAREDANVELRSLELTDPPLLVALPFLLSERAKVRMQPRPSSHGKERGGVRGQMVPPTGAAREATQLASAG